jgi:NUMOD3 motif
MPQGSPPAPDDAIAGRKHGHTSRGWRSPTYSSWVAMRRRCENPRGAGYENYGGRGIRVCDRWINSFEAFLEDLGERPDGMTLDRIDNDGDYRPGNVRWAAKDVQNLNRRARRPASDETRSRLSAAMKGRPSPNKGKSLSAEQRAKISEALKGSRHTAETCAKMSATRLGRKQSPEHIAKRVATRLANGNYAPETLT